MQSFFVFASLLSDYTLKFDEWVVTRPDFKDDPSVERKRWIGVLKTSLLYAILEPLWYWLMTTISSSSPWWLLMGSLVHLSALPSSIVLMGECMTDVIKRHNEICGDTKELVREEEGKANEKSEKAGSDFSEYVGRSDEQTPAPKVDLRPCLDRHPLSRIYPFVPLLPIVTAAMSNAGLLFYTRYLKTQDSQIWFERFSFGWIVIGLLCAAMYTMSRWGNKMMHQACGRPLHLYKVPWDVLKYRIGALLLMILLRAAVRSMLSQDPFTWFAFGARGEMRLLGDVDTSDGPGTSRDNKKHMFDRMLAAVPPWVGTTISIVNALAIWGYLLYSWRQKKRQQQRNAKANEISTAE